MAFAVDSGVNAGGEVEQDPGREAGACRVRGGGAHAVVRGDAHDVNLVDAVLPQPVGKRRLRVIDTLESAVRRSVRSLPEDRRYARRVQVGMEVRPGRVGCTQCGGHEVA